MEALTKPPPRLSIEKYPDTDANEFYVKGWDELQDWGRLYSTTWHQAYTLARVHHLTDYEFLQLLTGALVTVNESLKTLLLKRAEMSPCLIPDRKFSSLP